MMLCNCEVKMVWDKGCCSQMRNAVVELAEDIGDVLPHLGAAIEGSVYDPRRKLLRLARGERDIFIHPRTMVLTDIEDEAEARALVEWLKALIDEVHERHKQSLA